MTQELPHYLRFARALALVGGVACAGCSSTVSSQDVPPTETAVVDAGITVAPDRVSPDIPAPGIVAAPDVGVVASPDVAAMDLDASTVADGALDRPFFPEGGPQVAPELPWA